MGYRSTIIMMQTHWSFDAPHYQSITEARLSFIAGFLPKLSHTLSCSSALDVGCGLGEFSSFLAQTGLPTLGIDGREENVLEARRRYPQLRFATYDMELGNVRELGSFDLTFCFGLLYHLESPIAAIRNLYALTRKAVVIESMIHPGRGLSMGLVEEPPAHDQGIRSMATVLSEPALIKSLYRAGFLHVYMSDRLPLHQDFRETRLYRRRRTCLIATRQPVTLPGWRLAPEPKGTNAWLKVGAARMAWLQHLAQRGVGRLIAAARPTRALKP